MILESVNVSLSNENEVQVVIRHAIKSDLSMIWENFNSVVSEKKFIPVISEITNKYEQESWFYNHQNENNIVLVAVIDKVVGHCTIEHNNWECSEQAGELGILINKKYRNAKPSIGGFLMKNALREAKLKGFEKVNLSVFHTNTNAIELYKKLGFKIVGIRKKQFLIEGIYYDEVMMDYFID